MKKKLHDIVETFKNLYYYETEPKNHQAFAMGLIKNLPGGEIHFISNTNRNEYKRINIERDEFNSVSEALGMCLFGTKKLYELFSIEGDTWIKYSYVYTNQIYEKNTLPISMELLNRIQYSPRRRRNIFTYVGRDRFGGEIPGLCNTQEERKAIYNSILQKYNIQHTEEMTQLNIEIISVDKIDLKITYSGYGSY